MWRLVLFTLLVVSAFAEKVRFDNFRVYSISPRTKEQLSALKSLELKNEYNFWTEVRSLESNVDVMVAPQNLNDFHSFLKENSLDFEVKINNVQSLIDAEESVVKSRGETMDWRSYYNLEEIYNWMDDLAEKYPENVKVLVVGHTFEGREIKVAEIRFKNAKTGVLIESGIHAREWIGPAVTTYMVNEILKNNSHPVLKKFNYVFVPVLNPDGYEYTWTKDRMWRKSRSLQNKGKKKCYGVDLNRNWDFHWNEIGSSQDPCSEIYAGPSSLSEVELKNYSTYVKKVSKEMNVDLYLIYHSYSQLILYPWAYNPKPAPKDKIFQRVGAAAAKSLKAVHQTQFKAGSASTILYPSSGTSVDWYYATFNATISFAYELRDTGYFGFVLPSDQIIPSSEETFESLKTILKEYLKLKVDKNSNKME